MPERRGYLILSDFHLGEGRDPDSGRVSPKEDFFFDHEFAHLVDVHLDETVWDGCQWTLILNGDLIDFLQVTSIPESRDYRFDSRYGLKAGRRESCWKLQRVAAGHEDFFEGLARFAVRFPVVLVVGNHDIEFTYPEVQETLRVILAGFLDPEPAMKARRNLRIEPWFYFDGLVYVEHGHRFDPVNSFPFQLDPRLPESAVVGPDVDDIELPLGSMFVRYLFNVVETASPFADNIKPATRFIRWFAFAHPWQSLRFLFSDGREMMRRIRRKSRVLANAGSGDRRPTHEASKAELSERLAAKLEADPAAVRSMVDALDRMGVPPLFRQPGNWRWRVARSLIGPWRTPLLMSLLLAGFAAGLIVNLAPLVLPHSFMQWMNAWPAWSGVLADGLRWMFLSELAALGIWYVGGKRRGPRERNLLRRAAAEIAGQTGARFVVMGHTHDSDLHRLNGQAEYFNAGTWTRIFGEDWVYNQEKELNYVWIQATPSGWKGRLMRWEPQAGRGRLAYLFDERNEVSEGS